MLLHRYTVPWKHVSESPDHPPQVRMAVSLTTLLVLYTLFSNISDSLPVTAYVKMIDMWFFSSISLLFFITMIHVLTEHLRERQKVVSVHPILRQNSPQPIKLTAEKVIVLVRVWVVPLVVVILNIVYWVLLLQQASM